MFLLVSLWLPFTTHASIFSYVSKAITNKLPEQNSVTASANSQTMTLLRAPINPAGNNGIGGPDITIVDDSALVAENGPAGTTADEDNEKLSDKISIYVTRKGDTIAAIAKMFNVSENTVIWSNDLKRGSALKEGQTLTILPVTGIRHSVTSGETLASIVKLHKGDLAEVMQYNDLDEKSKLAIGTIIIIPDGEATPPPTAAPKKKSVVAKIGQLVRNESAPTAGSGYFAKPVSGYTRTQGLHGPQHNGVDLASYYGAPIYAAASGEVIISKDSGWNGGYGEYIVVDHPNGTQTLYAHLSETSVAVGAHVEQGQVIGSMGSTGKSTGTHLHFEVRGSQNPF